MVKKIIAVASSFLMLLCIVPFAAFADVLDTCPKCGERTYVQETGLTVDACGIGVTYNTKHCTSCRYSYYEWSLFGRTGYKEFESGTGDNLVADFISEWIWANFGKNANFKKYETGGGSAGTGGVGRRPSGYADDKGTPSISRAGLQAIALKPVFRYRMRSGYPLVKSGEFSGLTFDGTENANSSYSVQVSANRLDVKNTSDSSIAWGRFYVSYEYTFPDYGTVYFDTDNISWKLYGAAQNTDGEISDVKSWSNGFTYVNPNDKTYGYRSVEPTFYRFWKPFTVYDTSRNMLTAGRTGRAVFSDTIIYFKAADSPIINQTNITINNNTWNGNIYQDNSTNLTYIYPQYTTINENNETVTNISNNPIIYNNETKQYYTYDTVTNNYYYITYEAPTPSPSPDPTPTPDPGTDPTPTPEPGGDTGDTSGIMKILQEIKAVLVSGFAGITEKLQNIGVGGSTPETAKPGSSSGNKGQSWWEKLLGKIGDAIVDGLLGAISAVLKLIFKLFTTILGWIIWLVSQVLTLFPFLPPGLGALLIGGVVVCFIIGLIKFIRG